jgi:Holliday junction resolvasome RuvABC endonuclease subunit
MTPVGLDLSLTSTGISLPDVNTFIASKKKGPARLVEIRDKVLEYLQTVPSPIVIVEGYSFGSRNSQAHATGELGGVIRVALHERSIPYVEVPPTCRAKFATGKGNAGKNEVISSVSARTGIVWTGGGADDMCDAWLLREMGLTKLGVSEISWPTTHLAGMDKVDWTNLSTGG